MSERPEPDKATTQAGPQQPVTPPKKNEPPAKTTEKPGTGKPPGDKKKPPDDDTQQGKKGLSGSDTYPDGYTMYLSEDGTITLLNPDGTTGHWDKAAEVWVDPDTGVVRPTGWSNGHELQLTVHSESSKPKED